MDFESSVKLSHLDDRMLELRKLLMSQRPLRFTIWGEDGAVEANFLPPDFVKECVRVELQRVAAEVYRLRKDVKDVRS